MGLDEISKKIAEQLNLDVADVKATIRSFCDNTVGICHAGGRVIIEGFGRFEAKLVDDKPLKVPNNTKGAEEGTFIEGETAQRWLLKFYSADAADEEVNEPFEDGQG